MPRKFADRPYIATGFNNAANMQPLYKLGTNPVCDLPYFIEYKDENMIEIRFSQNEGTQLTGDRRQIPINLPTAQWEFAVLSLDDYNFLADTFCSNRLDGEVTIRTYDFENDTWANYNAIMQINTQDRSAVFNGFEFRPFIIQFIDMRAI